MEHRNFNLGGQQNGWLDECTSSSMGSFPQGHFWGVPFAEMSSGQPASAVNCFKVEVRHTT